MYEVCLDLACECGMSHVVLRDFRSCHELVHWLIVEASNIGEIHWLQEYVYAH